MPKQLTIRGVSEETERRLKQLSEIHGLSINATVLRILERALGVDERRRRLSRYATWTAEDLAEFEGALADQRRIDEELWR